MISSRVTNYIKIVKRVTQNNIEKCIRVLERFPELLLMILIKHQLKIENV